MSNWQLCDTYSISMNESIPVLLHLPPTLLQVIPLSESCFATQYHLNIRITFLSKTAAGCAAMLLNIIIKSYNYWHVGYNVCTSYSSRCVLIHSSRGDFLHIEVLSMLSELSRNLVRNNV